jgi:hypothetical protein
MTNQGRVPWGVNLSRPTRLGWAAFLLSTRGLQVFAHVGAVPEGFQFDEAPEVEIPALAAIPEAGSASSTKAARTG